MSRLQSRLLSNETIVREYSDGEHRKWKFCIMNAVKNGGYEEEREPIFRSERSEVNDGKLSNNIVRARTTIFELAYCNSWEWFFTGTLDPEKFDRENLPNFHKVFTQWLRNYGKKYGIKINFLIVPELHSDGKNWHFHGLLSGLPVEHLHQFQIGDKMGAGLAVKVKRGDIVFDWTAYRQKFGWCDVEAVRSHEAVSKYMTKYVTKDLGHSVSALGAHLYYCSRGLNRSAMVKRGILTADIVPDFRNDYCQIKWVDDEREAQYLIDTIL